MRSSYISSSLGSAGFANCVVRSMDEHFYEVAACIRILAGPSCLSRSWRAC